LSRLCSSRECWLFPRGAVANYVNAFAVQSLAYTATFDTLGAAARIQVPTLIVHSEHALSPALARRFFSRLAGPREEVWLSSPGQIDFYDRRPLIDAAADAIVDFFGRASATAGLYVTQLVYPRQRIEQSTLDRTDRFLASPDLPPALARQILEARDGVARALRAQACDVAAGQSGGPAG